MKPKITGFASNPSTPDPRDVASRLLCPKLAGKLAELTSNCKNPIDECSRSVAESTSLPPTKLS